MTVPHLLIPEGKTLAFASRTTSRTRGVMAGLLVGPFTRIPCHVELTLLVPTMVPRSLRATRPLVPLTWTTPPLAHRTERDEVQTAGFLKSFQAPRHGRDRRPTRHHLSVTNEHRFKLGI